MWVWWVRFGTSTLAGMTVPVALRGKLFRARDAIDAGLLRPGHLRTRAWRRVFQGVYADAALTVTHGTRCMAAMAFLLPDGAVIAGKSAAVMHGVPLGDRTLPVEALTPGTRLRYRTGGLVVHRGTLAPTDRISVNGIPVTSVERTCWDLAQWLDVVESVVWIDQILTLGRTTTADLTRYLDRRRQDTVRGVRRFERAASLVDARSESQQESRLRVRLTLAGLPPPEVQFTILDDSGRFVARVDLAWPELRLAIEYDGLWHVGSASQMHADRRRLNALAGLGWTVLHVTSARLRDDFDAVLVEIRTAMRRRR
jgi:very-short-patch-repair endonuclease